MQSGIIKGANLRLGAPKDWKEGAPQGETCGVLAVREEPFGRTRQYTSAWYPTPAEISAIVCGAPIHLNIVGHAHPPVMLSVGPVR